MLDIKYIKSNIDEVKNNIKIRFVNVDVDKVVELYDKRNQIQVEIDNLRQQRNENAGKMKGKLEQEERNKLIEEGKQLKEKISSVEEKYNEINKLYNEEYLKIPNMTHPTTPIGETEEESNILKKTENKPNFTFEPKDHIELGKDLDIIDFESAAKVSGQKFYYLKNEGAMLELALVQYAMRMLGEKGYTPFITPDLAKVSVVEGIGFNPKGEETNIYSVENTDLCLVGTAEITLGGLYQNEIIPEDKLPIKMAGFSHCFRTEAGAAGKAQKGLYRVHQFSKVEMFIICKENDSQDFHEELREIEEEIHSRLKVPYRVLDMASGDLGAPAYKKYDLEAWMPGRDEYGEITSVSNCTDYQARRLNIRYKDKEGQNRFAHMLNGTAVAVPRLIISILENFQTKEGNIKIPDILVPYTGFDEIKKKS